MLKNNTNIAPIPYIPQSVTKPAMQVYALALVTCIVAYMSYALSWKWIIFGMIEVMGFFYFANHLSKKWIQTQPITFAKKLFWSGFIIRVAWALISYLLYQNWTGTAFSIDAGDELFYDEVAHYAAGLMREGDWHIYSNIVRYSGAAFSDMGYPIYLSILYYIFGDSILIARINPAA